MQFFAAAFWWEYEWARNRRTMSAVWIEIQKVKNETSAEYSAELLAAFCSIKDIFAKWFAEIWVGNTLLIIILQQNIIFCPFWLACGVYTIIILYTENDRSTLLQKNDCFRKPER